MKSNDEVLKNSAVALDLIKSDGVSWRGEVLRSIGIAGEGAGTTLDIGTKHRRALLTEDDFLNFATKKGDRDLAVSVE